MDDYVDETDLTADLETPAFAPRARLHGSQSASQADKATSSSLFMSLDSDSEDDDNALTLHRNPLHRHRAAFPPQAVTSVSTPSGFRLPRTTLATPPPNDNPSSTGSSFEKRVNRKHFTPSSSASRTPASGQALSSSGSPKPYRVRFGDQVLTVTSKSHTRPRSPTPDAVDFDRRVSKRQRRGQETLPSRKRPDPPTPTPSYKRLRDSAALPDCTPAPAMTPTTTITQALIDDFTKTINGLPDLIDGLHQPTIKLIRDQAEQVNTLRDRLARAEADNAALRSHMNATFNSFAEQTSKTVEGLQEKIQEAIDAADRRSDVPAFRMTGGPYGGTPFRPRQ